MRRSPIAAALVLVATMAACGSATRSAGDAPPDGLRVGELEALYRARMDSARMRFTEADVRFMTDMIGHHAQALVMARLAAPNGASASIRTLAARIINAQEDEIRIMQQWLRERGQPVLEVHIEGTTLMVHGAGSHPGQMPGMLTAEQMRELASTHGAEFDRLFLTYMIQHHRGAVIMVQELFATDGAAQDAAVFRFASDVHVDQQTEIARMELMLSTMASGPTR